MCSKIMQYANVEKRTPGRETSNHAIYAKSIRYLAIDRCNWSRDVVARVERPRDVADRRAANIKGDEADSSAGPS